MKGRPSRLPMYPPELNLVPLLDMVSLLIQLMLVNAQFGVYAEIAAQAASSVAAEERPGLELEVVVSPEGHDVQWNEEGSGRTRRHLACRGGCDDPADYDLVGLAALATDLDAARPEEDTVVLRPAVGVSFDALVATMDALRGPEGEGARFPDVVLAGAPAGGAPAGAAPPEAP